MPELIVGDFRDFRQIIAHHGGEFEGLLKHQPCIQQATCEDAPKKWNPDVLLLINDDCFQVFTWQRVRLIEPIRLFLTWIMRLSLV